MTDVIIIGGGTAGLTAAIYCARANRQVKLFEGAFFGGQIVNSPLVENYPALPDVSGYDYSQALKGQARSLGAELISKKVVAIEKTEGGYLVKTRKDEYECRALIAAVGASPKKLGLPREDELIGSGISFCATCDGNFYKNADVAVVGGGETAVQDALYLSDICNKVYLIHRRDGFRAAAGNVAKLRDKQNVEFVIDSVVTKLKGDVKLEGVSVADKNGGERDIPVKALFEAVGQTPNTALFAGLVGLDPAGYIVAGEDCITSEPGIFAAGDCRTKTLRQLTTAAADGSVAATAAVSV